MEDEEEEAVDGYKETKTNQPLLLGTNTEGNRVVTCMMGIGGHTQYKFVEKVDKQSNDDDDQPHVLKTNIEGNRVITSMIGRGLGGHVIHNIVEEVGEQRSKEATEREIMMISLQSHWGDHVLRFPDHSYQ